MEKTEATQKMLSYFGLAVKAGRVACGSDNAEKAIKGGQAFLTVIAEDTGSNTVKHFSDMCAFRSIPCIQLQNGSLENATGKNGIKVLCITDAGFANAVNKEIKPLGVK